MPPTIKWLYYMRRLATNSPSLDNFYLQHNKKVVLLLLHNKKVVL
ncbi:MULTISPECIES: hypothetical protein [unclassified Okeania]|nr:MULTISPECIES: hypothetical protein [unclassified Okeania]